jgi:hypothetical protein
LMESKKLEVEDNKERKNCFVLLNQ